MSGSSDEQMTAMWQRVIQIPTRALFKRYLKATNTDKGRATSVLHEYKRLLTLKALDLDVDGTRIASSPALTAMWQQHVLDTAAYAACCTALCGSLCVAMSRARPVGPASAYAYQAAGWPRLTEARGTA